MSIYLVNYCKTLFPKPDPTIILGIPTYNALHQTKIELKTNALSINFNLGGATHVHLILLMAGNKYAILSNEPCEHPVHTSIILILNNATRVASYKLKYIKNYNLPVCHKVCGVKKALIQKNFTSVDEHYTIATKKWSTGQFTGNIGQIAL